MNKRDTLDTIGIITTIIGVCIELLTYFGIKSNQVTDILRYHAYVLYGLAALLIIWGIARICKRLLQRSGHSSHSKRDHLDDEFRSSFARCPYWIKVFLKTILDKGTAYSDANDSQFESYSQLLLQFIDYKTINNSVWQYFMRSEAKTYFLTHIELLGDVTDEEVRQHTLRSSVRYILHICPLASTGGTTQTMTLLSLSA